MPDAPRDAWKKVTLRDICEVVQYGYTASARSAPAGPKFLRITDIVPTALDWSSVPYCEISEDKVDRYTLRDGDIVIARTGATTGYAKLMKHPPKAVFASYLVRLSVKDGIDSRYVGAIVESAEYKRFIMTNIGGAAQPNANAQVLTTFPILLPPLQVQRKISAVLSAYDDLIENNLRRIAILDEMVRLAYREWFLHLRFPGHAESANGTIPAGWELATLSQLATETRMSVNPQEVDGDTPYIGLEHLPRRCIALGDWSAASEVQSTKLRFNQGDILFGKIRPYFHKVAVAPVDGICSSDAIIIRPLDPKYYGIVLACVSSDEFVDHSTQTSQGTKMPRANWEVLLKYPVPVPPEPLLMKFDTFVTDIVGLLRNVVLHNRLLAQTRDLLLPRLISGELDLSEPDIDIGAAGT